MVDPNSQILHNLMMKTETLINIKDINNLNIFGAETRSFEITGNGKSVKAAIVSLLGKNSVGDRNIPHKISA